MQAEWVKRKGGEKLGIIVLGWASGPEMAAHIAPEGCDLLVIYDYRDMTVPEGFNESLAAYPCRTIAAWSFGVWAAERLFAGQAFDRAVALNGTPFPADDHFGLGARRLAVTLRGLARGGMEQFDRKAYEEFYDLARGKYPGRPLTENIAELENLAALSAVPYTPSIAWDSAIVGSRDEIFPPENMLRYWGNKAEEVNLPHFPFGDRSITDKLF